MIKTYWYCAKHDDVFYATNAEPDKPNKYALLYCCCSFRLVCELSYIGYMDQGDHNNIIKDTTPDAEWFNRRGNYTKYYLEFAKEIKLDLIKNIRPFFIYKSLNNLTK
jgi:hypothetical protein